MSYPEFFEQGFEQEKGVKKQNICLGRPKLPGYKHKTEGRNILVYTIQAISKRGLKL